MDASCFVAVKFRSTRSLAKSFPATLARRPGECWTTSRRFYEPKALLSITSLRQPFSLRSLGDFQTVNEIYGSYFKQDPPARSTVEVSALPRGANVEIEVIAAAAETDQTAYDTSG